MDEDGVMEQMRLRAQARRDAARGFLERHPLVGLPVEQAHHLAREAGVAFRAVDLAQPIFSADLQPGRITAMARHGVVVTAEVGN